MPRMCPYSEESCLSAYMHLNKLYCLAPEWGWCSSGECKVRDIQQSVDCAGEVDHTPVPEPDIYKDTAKSEDSAQHGSSKHVRLDQPDPDFDPFSSREERFWY